MSPDKSNKKDLKQIDLYDNDWVKKISNLPLTIDPILFCHQWDLVLMVSDYL